MKTIRVKDQSTQTTPSLTTRPPFKKTIEHSTPFETPEIVKNFRQEETLAKSSNLILEPSKTPLNFDQSSSPHFMLSVDETPDVKPKTKNKKKSLKNNTEESSSSKKLKFIQTENDDLDHLLSIDHSDSKQFSIHESESKQLALNNHGNGQLENEPDKNAKKRGRPKKKHDSVEKAATIPTKHDYKKEPKMPKSEPMVTMKTRAKQTETPLVTKKSSITVVRMKQKLDEDETQDSPKTGSPNSKRQRLHKQRENLMKKIEMLEIKLENYHYPNPNLRRSLRIKEKMIKTIKSDISMLMSLVHFVERQDEILMRQQRKYREKNESYIKMPVGRRAKKLRIVSDEEFSS